MKLKTEPLLMSAGIGAAIWIVGGLIALVLGVQMMQTMIDAPVFDPAYLESIDPNTTDPFTALFGESFRSTMVLSSAANLIQCLSWLVSGIAAGALYVVFHRRREPMAAGNEAFTGAVAGTLAVVMGYLVSTLLSMVVIMPQVNTFMNRMMATAGPEAAQAFDQMGGLIFLFSVLGIVCSLVLYAAIGAATGAVGGLLGNSLAKPAA